MLPSTIIELLSRSEMSLADLQAVTQVSMPTLRRAMQELVESDWVSTVGQSTTTRGRPAMLFGLNATKHLILGVHLQLPGLRLITVDLPGNVLDDLSIDHYHTLSPDELIQEIADYARRVEQKFPQRHILGIGIAAPGFTDPQSGEIISIGRVLGWQNFPIRARIMATVGLPTVLANDIDCMALAEVLDAPTATDETLVYVGFYEGIKASMFLHGELYKGPFGNAGIIGRSRLRLQNEARYEPLESLASVHVVTQRFHQEVSQLDEAEQAVYKDMLAESNTRRQFQRIMEAANTGDERCQAIFANVIELLSVAVANLIYIIQPGVLIIGGALSTMPLPLFNTLEAQIRQHLPPLLSNQLLIQQARLSSPNSVPIGVAHQFLRHYITTDNFELVKAEEISST